MKRRTIASLSVSAVIVIVAGISLYTLVLRQPDSSYETLSKSLSIVKEKENLVSKSVSSLSLPFFITEGNLASYSGNLSELITAVKSVDSNPIVKNDQKLNDTYKKYKNDIQSYISSNNNLISSIKLYFNISKTCGDMGYSLDLIRTKSAPMTSSVFDTESKDCQAAVTAGASSPDEKFSKQFLSDYLTYINTLISAYRQEFNAAGNASTLKSSQTTIETTWNSIQLMNNGYLLGLTRSPDPTNSITSLASAIESQKKALFR